MKLFFRLLTITSLLVVILGGVNFDLPKSQAQTSYTVETYGTIHSAGIQIKGVPADVTSATMQYKKRSESNWKDALDPIVTEGNSYTENYDYSYVKDDPNTTTDDPYVCAGTYPPIHIEYCYFIWPVWKTKEAMIRRVNGSIMYLSPDTTYDLKVIIKKSGGAIYDTVNNAVKTRPNEVAYGTGQILQVAKSGAPYTTISSAISAATAGDTITVGAGSFSSFGFSKSGDTTKGPITVKGIPGQTIISGGVSFSGGVHDIIVEGMTFSSGKITTGAGSSRITIQNNRFEGSASGAIELMNKNYDWLIQNNVISGSIWNPIRIEESHGLILRYNDVRVGGVEDIVIFRDGPHFDDDIYGNYFEGSPSDDGMELEGGVEVNVRMWDNTLKVNSGPKATISNVPIMVGPVYIFRNTFYGAQQGVKYAGKALDLAATYDDWADLGPVFYYNNDFHFYGDRWSSDSRFFRYGNICRGNFHLRNNSIYGRLIQTDAIDNTFIPRSGASNSGMWGIINTDYNLFWRGSGTTNPNAHHPGIDANSVFADPKHVTPTPTTGLPDLHLSSSSPGINKGVFLANITDTFVGSAPDIGRYEFSEGTGITLTKSVDKSTSLSGEILTYTISYIVGTQSVTSAKIEDSLDTTKVTIVDQGGATLSGSTLIWNLGNLAAGASGTRTFKVQVK